ncbi:hypothetical protein KCU99_g293, partial [Aureobasidium melanogenum]
MSRSNCEFASPLSTDDRIGNSAGVYWPQSLYEYNDLRILFLVNASIDSRDLIAEPGTATCRYEEEACSCATDKLPALTARGLAVPRARRNHASVTSALPCVSTSLSAAVTTLFRDEGI